MSNSGELETGCDFGSVLATARKAQDYTVDEIYKQLKIPKQVITAIEKNDLDALPIPTYTQGYIRNYARFLDVSEDKILALYNRAAPHVQAAKLKPRSSLKDEKDSLSLLIKLVTALLLVAGIATLMIGVFQYYQGKADDMENTIESKEEAFSGNSLDSPGVNRLEIKQNARLTTDGQLIVEKSDAIISLQEELDSEIVESKDTEKTTDVGREQDALEIKAEKGSWIEVRDANNARLFYNMLPKGGSKTFLGQAPFSVSLGNAKTTRLIINDLEVDMVKYIRPNNTVKFKVSSDEKNVIIN